MVFNDTTNKVGIIQHCEMRLFGDNGYGQISGNSDRLYQFTERINRAQDRFNFLAMSADGRWQWDDSNNTDFNIATTNLVSGQRDYTFALQHLEIEKVLVKDSGGSWRLIDPFDQNDEDAKAYLENNGPSGVPHKYDKRGNSIILFPTPNYSSTDGLQIYYKRGPVYFDYTDTAETPGFTSIFHDYLPLHASAHYAIDRGLATGKSLFELVQIQEQTIKEFYSRRNRDEKPRLVVGRQNNK